MIVLHGEGPGRGTLDKGRGQGGAHWTRGGAREGYIG